MSNGRERDLDARVYGPFDALLFDQDGTIVDSEPLQYEAWRRTAESYGVIITEEVFAAEFAGEKQRVIAEKLIRMNNLRGGTTQTLEEAQREVYRNILDQAQVMPGARELLQSLREQGVKTALVTMSGPHVTHANVERLGLMEYFDVIITRQDIPEGKGKPDPHPYLLAAKKLGVLPQMCCGFEDFPVGVHSIVSAGMTCIAVPSQYVQRLDFSNAHARVDSLERIAIQERKVYIR